MKTNNTSSIAAILSLTAETALTVELTAGTVIAAGKVYGARESAKAVLARATANDCQVLLALINSASSDEQKELLTLTKTYIQAVDGAFASPTHTVAKDSDGHYVWTRRDPAVLERNELTTQMAELEPYVKQLADVNADTANAILNEKTPSIAAARRKLKLYESVKAIITALNDGEAALHAAGFWDVAIDSIKTMSPQLQSINANYTVLVELVNQSKNLSAQVTAAQRENKLLVTGFAKALANVRAYAEGLPTSALPDLKSSNEILHSLKKDYAEFERLINSVKPDNAALVEEVMATLTADGASMPDVLATATARLDGAEKLLLAEKRLETTVSEVADKHAAELKKVAADTQAEAKAALALEEAKAFAMNCSTAGLAQHHDYAMTLSGNELAAYKRQLNTMVTHVLGEDDADKQETLAAALGNAPMGLADLKEYWAGLLFDSVGKGADRNLLSSAVLVNKDSHDLAKAIVGKLPGMVDGLLTKYPDLEASRETVLIALHQQLGEMIAGFGHLEQRKAG